MKSIKNYFQHVKEQAHFSKKSYIKKNGFMVGIVVVLLALPVILVATTRNTNLFSNASTTNTVEPETGIMNGATVVNDANASGGQAVDFGNIAGIACAGVQVSPGQDIQSIINSNAEGTKFCFAPGVYRISTQLNPKNNQQFIGAYGAVLNGSKVVTGFTQSGSNWVATGFLPSSPSTHGECATEGCTYTQDVFIDGQPLIRVVNLASLAPGKYYEDFAANKIYMRDNPTGRLVEQAYANAIFKSAATGVTIKNFIIEKAATVSQGAAVETLGNPANWTIQYNEFRYNHAGGVYANNGSLVSNNYIHHQGQTGIYGNYGAITVENNEVAFNNTAGYNHLWEAGGSKWALTDGTIIRGNYFHDNKGPGIWTDIINNNVLIENNVTVRNLQVGIFHEISYSAVIRNNISMDNTNICAFSYYCGAQILVSASRDVEVYGNTVRGWGGIGMLQQDRPEYPSPLGEHIVQNVYIHDNTTHGMPDAAIAGAVTDTGDNSVFTSRNNRYANNHYHLVNLTGQYFYWLNGYHQVSAWQGFGFDTTGTFDTNIDNNPPQAPQLTVGPQNTGSTSAVTATVTVSSDGTYRVWSRIMASDSTNNSYKLQIDNGTPITIGDTAIPSGTWTWVDHRDGNTASKVDVALTAGSHTLTLTGNESNVKVDRLVFTTDTACVPIDKGDNCTVIDTPTPTVTPVVPTNTPTPTPVTGVPVTVGYQTWNGQYDSGNNNGITSTQVISGSNGGSLNNISVYIGAVGAAPSNHMQIAMYADNGANAPGTLLGSTGSQILTPNSWNTFPLSGITIGSNTKYWLAFNVNSGTTQYGRSSWTTGLSAWKIPTTFGTWPNPIGTLSEPVGTHAYAIYMTYTTTGVVNTPTPTVALPSDTPTPTPFIDTVKPTVTITYPVQGSLVPRRTNITVQATASDNVGVTKVEFRRNGSRICTDITAPYSCSMNTANSRNVTVTYEARAYDSKGNTGTSTVSVRTQ